MAYSVEVVDSAQKELANLAKPAQRQVLRAMDKLGEDPRHAQTRKLAGSDLSRRVGAGRNYPIIYVIQDEVVRVLVIAIGHRREIYRRRFP